MRHLTIRLFGGLDVRCGTPAQLVFPTRKARGIFAFLALSQGRTFSRDVLCGMFWEESPEEVARKGLRTELWRIRHAFESIPVDPDRFLLCLGSQVGVRRDESIWVDTIEFEERVHDVHHATPSPAGGRHRENLERAVELYRGDLLEGMYDRWCCTERGRLRLEFLRVLEELMRYHGRRGEWMRAIERGSELLRQDAIREHVHRELMQYHYAMGNRPAAIRQYRECVRTLRRELDIDPMPETRALFQLIHRGADLPHTPA